MQTCDWSCKCTGRYKQKNFSHQDSSKTHHHGRPRGTLNLAMAGWLFSMKPTCKCHLAFEVMKMAIIFSLCSLLYFLLHCRYWEQVSAEKGTVLDRIIIRKDMHGPGAFRKWKADNHQWMFAPNRATSLFEPWYQIDPPHCLNGTSYCLLFTFLIVELDDSDIIIVKTKSHTCSNLVACYTIQW